jgi:hypothetical protein
MANPNNNISKGAFTSLNISAMSEDSGESGNFIWDSKKINKLIEEVALEGKDIRGMKNSPFKDNDIVIKRANLPFQYTPEEWEELEKCKVDPMYFAYKYAFIRTSNGDMTVEMAGGLRDFQSQIISNMHNNKFNILMASRQIGKTVTTAMYIVWFLLFKQDKNVLMVADNFDTTKEIMEKLRIVLDNLPFFMKPGIVKINESSIRLDNNCRLILRTTTKKSGIGMTINFLYIDEFAHIDGAKLDKFYRTLLPVITEDPEGKVMITSTPNGRNKFWESWKDAVDGVNTYSPMRVDWWQVPGRDEAWKRETIANFGTEADFNQEYGLQFFSSDQLLLNAKDLRKLEASKYEYVNANLDFNEDFDFINEYLTVHPKLKSRTIDDWRNDPSYYVFSIDTADGTERGDYSVINIFKVVALPVKELLRKKETIKSELDTVSLVQVAKFRSNKFDINDFSTVAGTLIYRVFNPERVRIVLELNHKGDLVEDRLSQYDGYWWGQMVHTKHTQLAKQFKAGLRLGPTNKMKYCESFRHYVSINRIIPNDSTTYLELGSFGKSTGGQYRGQNGNDDLSMTCVNTSTFFDSPQFWDVATEVYEATSKEYKKDFIEKILNANLENANRDRMYDFKRLNELNSSSNLGRDNYGKHSEKKNNVFDPQTYSKMREIQSKFFKS